jgi:hypothetical protein
MTLTSDPEKQYGSSINDEDEVYQLEVLWSWSLQLGHYPAYNVFQLSDSMTLTFDHWP